PSGTRSCGTGTPACAGVLHKDACTGKSAGATKSDDPMIRSPDDPISRSLDKQVISPIGKAEASIQHLQFAVVDVGFKRFLDEFSLVLRLLALGAGHHVAGHQLFHDLTL